MLNLNYLFQLFARPTSICAINTAEGNKGHLFIYFLRDLNDFRLRDGKKHVETRRFEIGTTVFESRDFLGTLPHLLRSVY